MKDPLHRGQQVEYKKKVQELATKAMMEPKKKGDIKSKYPMSHFKKKGMSSV